MFFFMFYGIRYCLSNIASRSVLLQFNLWSSPICNWCLWWSWKSSFEANESFTWRSIRAMTYSSYKSRVWPLYKKFIWIKIDDIYILKIGKFMHSLHWGRIPRSLVHFRKSGPLPCKLCCHTSWIHFANRFDSQRQKISETPWPKSVGLHWSILLFCYLSRDSSKTNCLMNMVIDYPILCKKG